MKTKTKVCKWCKNEFEFIPDKLLPPPYEPVLCQSCGSYCMDNMA